MRRRIIACAAALIGCATLHVASAATILQTTELVASTASGDALLPDPIDFDVNTAGSYVITLKDEVNPDALGSLQAIVARDLQVVAQTAVEYGAPVLVPGTDTFSATPGKYRIHVLATVAAGKVAGQFSVSVTPAAGGSPVGGGLGGVAGDPAPLPDQTALEANFVTAQAGSYQLVVTDHQFPQPLAELSQPLLLQVVGADLLPVPLNSGTFVANAGDEYFLTIFARAEQGQGGLFSVSVGTGPTNVVYRAAQPVGRVGTPVDVEFPAAGTWSLTLKDAEFPEALNSFSAAVIQGNVVLGTLSGPITQPGPPPVTVREVSTNIVASQGAAQLFTFTSTSSVGALGVRLAQNATIALADIVTVAASTAPGGQAIYTFESAEDADAAAGTHTLTLRDYRLPQPFAELQAAVVQDGVIAGRIEEADDLDVTLHAGPVKVLVAALPMGTQAAPGNGLFGVELSAQPGGADIVVGTQGVGGLFRTHTIQIPAAGPYDLELADLEFPARLRISALAVTQGTELIAQIFGEGPLRRQTLQPGTYVLNFLGQPANNFAYGAYGVKVADSPPLPTLTFTANPASITSGARSSLQWTATNATSCTATGGWTGSKPLTGPEDTPALTANATFNLSCTGPGGDVSGSVTVTVTAPPPGGGGGGGGGSINLFLLAALALVTGWSRLGRRAAR